MFKTFLKIAATLGIKLSGRAEPCQEEEPAEGAENIILENE